MEQDNKNKLESPLFQAKACPGWVHPPDEQLWVLLAAPRASRAQPRVPRGCCPRHAGSSPSLCPQGKSSSKNCLIMATVCLQLKVFSFST